jgi:Mannosidase Ig/CBM-like domain
LFENLRPEGTLAEGIMEDQPVGIFMEHTTQPRALYAVNDSLADLGSCTAHWRVTSASGDVIAEDSQPVRLGPDSKVKIRDFNFAMKDGEEYDVKLDLTSPEGKILAHNVYIDPFKLQPLPKGFPERMDDELGMRLWWAGLK